MHSLDLSITESESITLQKSDKSAHLDARHVLVMWIHVNQTPPCQMFWMHQQTPFHNLVLTFLRVFFWLRLKVLNLELESFLIDCLKFCGTYFNIYYAMIQDIYMVYMNALSSSMLLSSCIYGNAKS